MRTIIDILAAAAELSAILLRYAIVVLVLLSPYIAEYLIDRWLGL